MNRKWLPVVYAVLGIVIGILLTLNYQKIFPSRTLKVSGHGWDKLQLVLQSVQDNYVDEVNYSEASEAAIEALLSKLDPHSLYMPPVQQGQLLVVQRYLEEEPVHPHRRL